MTPTLSEQIYKDDAIERDRALLRGAVMPCRPVERFELPPEAIIAMIMIGVLALVVFLCCLAAPEMARQDAGAQAKCQAIGAAVFEIQARGGLTRLCRRPDGSLVSP